MMRLKALLKMTRRKAILTGVSLLALVGVVAGGIRLVGAMSQSDGGDTELTKSVARIVWFDDGPTGWLCTGSVVGDDWVLTAYHCLYPEDMSKPRLDWHKFTVQLWKAGVKDINRPDYHSGLSDPPKVMANAWSGKSWGFRDVALLHVAKHMPDWAKTIPTAPSWPPIGTTLTEYGYGHLDSDPNGSVANSLYKSHQNAIRRTNCPSGQAWTTGQICISSNTSLPEHGDSGGPLLWWNHDYWQQVGSLTGDPLDGSKTRSYWSEADGDTRAWLLSWVFSHDTMAPGSLPPVGAILRDWQSGLSWQYQADGYRHWIPDKATYDCLMNNGAPFFFITAPEYGVPLLTIEALPDMKGNYATCNTQSPTSTAQSTATTGPTTPTATPGSTPPTPTATAVAPTWHARLLQPAPSCNNPGGVSWAYFNDASVGNTISCQGGGLLIQQNTTHFPDANVTSAFGAYDSNMARVKVHAHFINVNSSTYAGTDATILVHTPPGIECGGLEFEIRPTGQGRVQNPCTQAILFTYAVGASTDYDMMVETSNGTISGYINGVNVWSAPDTQSGGVAGLMVIDFAWPTAQVLYTNFELDQWN